VAQAVAVLGESADLPSVAALAQMDEQRVAAAIGALARAEILQPERPLDFVHPLVREVVYRDMTVARRDPPRGRRAVHRRGRPSGGRASRLSRRAARSQSPPCARPPSASPAARQVGDGPAAPRRGEAPAPGDRPRVL
jgi:hypothetical protein